MTQTTHREVCSGPSLPESHAGGGGIPRRQPSVRDTKQRILAAALELFGQRGYAEVSIPDIVERAGVTKGAFYYYYRNRGEVVVDLQLELWSRLKNSVIAAYDARADAVANMRAMFRAGYAALGAPEEVRFLREAWSSSDPVIAARVVHKEWVGPTAQFLRRAMAAGELVSIDPDVLASALVGAFSEMSLVVLRTGKVDDAAQVLDRFAEALRA